MSALMRFLPLLRNGGSLPPASANKRIAISGQSNSTGVGLRTEVSSAPLSSDAGLATMEAADFERVYIWVATANAYAKLRIGINNLGANATYLGPEFGLAVRWMRETVGGNLYIDKHDGFGQAISYFQSGGAFFTTTVSRHNTASAWLTTNSIVAPLAGMLWVQGESDKLMTQAEYLAALTTLMNSRTSAGLRGATDRIVLAQMGATSNAYGQGVFDAKVAYAAANSHASTVQMRNYLNGDNLHLNARGQVQLGYDAYRKLFDAAQIET